MKKTLLFFTLLLLSIPFFAQVQIDTFSVQNKRLYFQDKPIKSMKEMKTIVFSLNDPEATRQIKAAAQTRTFGYTTVFAAITGGMIAITNKQQEKYEAYTFLTTGALIGNILMTSSKKHRKKARLRYNEIVKQNNF